MTPGGPDLRLAGFALGTWLAILAAIRMSSATAERFAFAAGCVACVVAVSARRNLAPELLVAASILLGAACGAASAAAHTVARDDPTVRRLVAAGGNVRAMLVVASDPRRSRGSSPGRLTWVVPVTLGTLTTDAASPVIHVDAPALVLAAGARWPTLLPGQRIAVTGRLAVPRERDLTVAVITVRGPPTLFGRPPWYQVLAGRLRFGLQAACRGLPSRTGGLLPGLVDGDTSRLDPRVRRDFEAAGMSYLVVVAGLHLAIALGAVLALARWGRFGPRLQAGIGMAALGAFVVLARPGPSVSRAAAMTAIGLVAAGLGRAKAASAALLGGVFVLLVVNPQFAVQVGFLLSTLATFGLLTLVPAFRDRLCRRGMSGTVATALAIPLAAQLVCTPVVAAVWGVIGVSAIPANIVAEPLLAPAMLLGLAAMLISPVSPTAAHLLAWLGAWPCRGLVAVAHVAARVPAGVLPWPTGLRAGLVLTALLLVALWLWTYRPPLVIGPTVAILAVLAVGGVSATPVTSRHVALTPAPPSKASQCHARAGPLPDPACTPGALNPAVTQATIDSTICRAGWSETVRPPSTYTEPLKRGQIAAYGYLDQAPGGYEEDHLVPLSLGGAPSDPRNLWPEPGASPNTKDRVEWDLQAAVCTHQVSLAAAQRAVAANWTTAERELGL